MVHASALLPVIVTTPCRRKMPERRGRSRSSSDSGHSHKRRLALQSTFRIAATCRSLNYFSPAQIYNQSRAVITSLHACSRVLRKPEPKEKDKDEKRDRDRDRDRDRERERDRDRRDRDRDRDRDREKDAAAYI
eukprot:1653520-Amphidinium_carterae.1